MSSADGTSPDDQPAVERTSADDRLGNLVGALTLGLADRMREVTEVAAGQTAGAPAALLALRDMVDGGTVDRLRQVLALTPSGGVRLVDRLVAAGLVERRRGPDGRSLSLVLTTGGRLVADEVAAARSAAVGQALAELDGADRAALGTLVEKLIGGLTRQRLADRSRGTIPGGWLCRMCDFTACGRPEGRCPAATAAASSMA